MIHQAGKPHLPPLNRFTVLVELIIVVAVSVFALTPFLDLNVDTRLGGSESEYLTRSAFSISALLPRKGYIPLWQPYLEFGDPLLENPVSFAFNPLASVPSYVFGLYDGVKITLLLIAVSSGIGGWCLARVLGLGMLARLLTACLLIGKGNLHAYLVEGHFPLILAQAFFPWVFVAVVALFKGHRRWAVALLAVSYVMIFWSGIPWYPPAIALTIAILTFFFMFKREYVAYLDGYRWRIAWKPLGGVILGMVGAFLLSAALMYPLLGKADNIGESTVFTDFRADVLGVMGLYFSNVKEMRGVGVYPQGFAFSYYNYVSPLWFALLIAALLVLAVWLRRRWRTTEARFVLGFLGVFVFCTLWGAGQNPIIELFYVIIPYAAQFRHVERVFAISTVALIVLIGMSADVIWRYLVHTPAWVGQKWAAASRARRIFARVGIGAGLLTASGIAAFDVVRQWHVTWGEHFTQIEDPLENTCITWLRQNYPDAQLSVWTLSYKTIYTYVRNQVRHGWVASDFYHVRGEPSTLFDGWMQPTGAPPPQLLPEFAMGAPHFDEAWLQDNGYMPLSESVNPYSEGKPCIYRREGAYSYAWTTTRAQLDQYRGIFPVTETTPVTTLRRDYDRIGMFVQARADADVVVTVQESAYPGWQVFLNDQPAQVESLGGQLAVVLPRTDDVVKVYFQYLPRRFFIGSSITLVTALVTILYLMRAERLIPPSLRRRLTRLAVRLSRPKTPAVYARQLVRWLDPAPDSANQTESETHEEHEREIHEERV